MPMPPSPTRPWRPVIERGLAIFNGLVCAAMVVLRLTPGSGRSRDPEASLMDPFTTGMAVVIGAVALSASIGFLVRMPRALRACLILPSATLWLFLGSGLTLAMLFIVRANPSASAVGTAVAIAIGLVFLAIAGLSLESAFFRVGRHVGKARRRVPLP
jgi:hypothetical protein